ncbi:class III extradiol ring-cleavage dioxygenase family protein [Cellulomonas timonensis]|uniref:hypothetical protein n=1 Tax=Cellulomonas timonensis TaxID=1689271 RepID=UPI000829835B|nr:hypothetical protein [Cellulomonas timonensis]
MFAAAALVPETALLVPGAAGRADVLGKVREAALTALARVLDQAPDMVVVVAPGPVDRVLGEDARPSLAAAGIPDDALGWRPAQSGPESVAAGPGASVALLLLAAAGWRGPTATVEVGGGTADPVRLRAQGAALARSTEPSAKIALVVAGSLSARHGHDAPLAEDPQAVTVDAELLEAIADAGPQARALLAGSSAEMAQRLAISLWGPMQVLLGAADAAPVPPGAPDAGVTAEVLIADAPLGAQYVVATWLTAQAAR